MSYDTITIPSQLDCFVQDKRVFANSIWNDVDRTIELRLGVFLPAEIAFQR
jgi:hypothetical protein